jgi:hypothetical protein
MPKAARISSTGSSEIPPAPNPCECRPRPLRREKVQCFPIVSRNSWIFRAGATPAGQARLQ